MAPTRRSTTAPQQEIQIDSSITSKLQPLTAETVSSDLLPSSPPPKTSSFATMADEEAPVTVNDPLSIDQIYLSSKQSARENHWRNNPYATGLVEPTWRDEINRNINNEQNGANGPNRSCCADAANPEMDPTCGCLVFSGYVCGTFNAGRVGNMVILKESHVMVDEIIHDDDDDDDDNNVENGEGDKTSKTTGAIRTRKVSKRQIDFIVGPYWPMMIFVTYPLILIVSGLTAVKSVYVPNYNIVLVIIWSMMTFGLCFSLFNVAFKDPGILPKYKEIPVDGMVGNRSSSWRWIDKAQSFVPRGTCNRIILLFFLYSVVIKRYFDVFSLIKYIHSLILLSIVSFRCSI